MAITDAKTFISSERQEELKSWLSENGDKSPSVVKEALTHYISLIVALEGGKHRMRSLVLQLQRAMGITASSEKRKIAVTRSDQAVAQGMQNPKTPKSEPV